MAWVTGVGEGVGVGVGAAVAVGVGVGVGLGVGLLGLESDSVLGLVLVSGSALGWSVSALVSVFGVEGLVSPLGLLESGSVCRWGWCRGWCWSSVSRSLPLESGSALRWSRRGVGLASVWGGLGVR